MGTRFLATAASAALLAGAGQVSAAVISIDTFDTDQGVFDLPADAVGRPQGSEAFADEAIGDYRDLYVETDGNEIGDTALVVRDDPQNPSDGILSFSNQDGVTGRAWVTYDGNDGDPFNVATSGLGGLDFLDGPNAKFLFDVVRLDVGNLFIQVRVWDTFGEFTTFGGPIVAGGTPEAPLLDFTNPNFNWNSVGALQFYAESFGSTISQDSAVTSIRVDTGVIPLPASGLLLLGGLGGLSVFRARRKRG